MKRARKIHWNTFVIVSALIFCAGVYANISVGKLPRTSLKQVDPLLAQTACDTSFFTVQSPVGKSFGKSCIVNGGQMYAGDARYTFFLPATAVDHVAYVQTGNADIKDSSSLSWSITTQRAATIYVITRHIPNFPQIPGWISQSYSRQTNDDLSHIDQYFKRKNEQGLLGLYDVFS